MIQLSDESAIRLLNRLAPLRLLAAATLLGLLLAACGADVDTTDSPPPQSNAAATASAAATTAVLPTGGQDLTAGTYSLSDFPVGISFDIPSFESPAAWFSCSSSAVEQAVCYASTGDPEESVVALTFQIVENVVAGCSNQESAELLEPPVGPTVDDLVDAISNLEGYEASAPADISMSGFDGKEFTLTATGGCGATWATPDRVTGMGSDEINLLQVLDVDGERVLIASAYNPDTSQEDVAALEQVRDSVEIQP
jgi:hypothetical protein